MDKRSISKRNRKLRELIPSKKYFDNACAEARANCPQEEYRTFKSYDNECYSREALVAYWIEDEVLWEYEYCLDLPEDIKEVFRKLKVML